MWGSYAGVAPRESAPPCVATVGEPADTPRQRTKNPYVTGTSVIAFTYAGGVMMAADTLAAYGSTLRYKDVTRIAKVNEHTALGFSGEVSDATQILKYLDELSTSDFCDDDGATLDPSEVHSYLTRVMYNRRSKLDPLWNSLVVAGRRNGESFLGCVNLLGLAYEEDLIATGFGNHLAMPLLRAEHSKDMSYEAAKQLMERALLVCYYRDKNSINKFVLSTVTDEGVSIGEPFSVKTSWDLEAYKNPQQHATGTW
uniref:Proteasome subunit beta n=1 Tax=Prasinoderma singulare TaxID=676789 RepID=A0A7S3B773_9VIRI